MGHTNARAKRRVRRLVDLGVIQKKISERMGVDAGTLNKWIHNERDARWVPNADHLDGLDRYRIELAAAVKPDASSDAERAQAIDDLIAVAVHATPEAIQLAAESLRRAVEQPGEGRSIPRKEPDGLALGGKTAGKHRRA